MASFSPLEADQQSQMARQQQQQQKLHQTQQQNDARGCLVGSLELVMMKP